MQNRHGYLLAQPRGDGAGDRIVIRGHVCVYTGVHKSGQMTRTVSSVGAMPLVFIARYIFPAYARYILHLSSDSNHVFFRDDKWTGSK